MSQFTLSRRHFLGATAGFIALHPFSANAATNLGAPADHGNHRFARARLPL
jgi:hypothetical protein